ncbi:CaiB/BaiF CoA transferase family protein [Achromobacter aegrifaciens]|uniref:CaiB/BaiF CoA-transferase family protein n=1 Tax=Achromobacter aegrifaciens TaxID=1287736 RepID=A0AAD2KLK2_ACHAE|nr:CaiB/BaiF CoA-transferase family protein [Achromobacter aegrifaciens]PTN47607.1 CoA transferase [Achromobacter xylosoxidans]MDQ1758311.1 CaiB/BaiF CoA-transferase family protein [Achromobacter aegrifaciens]MDR7943570.1 CaiB/BaiF CoA-transferase family protein [Achromobacter aegrifaciens]CAB3869693.1 Acetyl-CoA:oxalate CoA-transferase [Achromobacter aegrifaciens]CAB3921673.1 Acetyl-CoA:oxalate CoA-transferase [Achromobacter aegrifaciens]
MNRPPALTGIRVLDLSRILAGPWCTQNLADLGADVIKIERPRVGDDTRAWGPPFLKDGAGQDTEESAYYLSANRNKRSVEADMATPAGAALIRELAAASDILVENFKVGGLAKYGLDYDSLKQINPRLIYCSVTGFGQDGPYAQRPGYDFMIQGMGGLMSITGERDDLPGGGPQKAGVAVTDIVTGMYATVAILAALQERHNSGLGQHLDIALLDSHVALLANQNSNYFNSGVAPQRAGNAHQNVVPYQVFAASDGHLIVATGNESQYRAYCRAIGAPELGDDPRFATNRMRLANRELLVGLLTEIMRQGQRDDWIAKLEAVGVPCGPINDIAQAQAHPQALARQLRRDMPHPAGGMAAVTASPLRLSASPVEYRRAPPLLGEHTEEVLREVLGKTQEEIAVFREGLKTTN